MPETSACARCDGPIERRPTSVAGWGHTIETEHNADGHSPVPVNRRADGSMMTWAEYERTMSL